MTPHRHAPAVVWAVYLGANTAQRVATQCCISKRAAAGRLVRAYRDGLLARVAWGKYSIDVQH